MKLQQLYIEDYQDVIRNGILSQQDCGFYAILPRNIVYKGVGDIDEQYCQEHDFQVYNSVDFGGGIVGFEGDIVIVIVKHEGWKVGENFMKTLNEYLQKQGLNSSLDGNDIMIDGIYKCASCSSVNISDRNIYTGIQITFNADADIIKHICKKESVKIPKGLNKYNINNQDVLQFVFEYFNPKPQMIIT